MSIPGVTTLHSQAENKRGRESPPRVNTALVCSFGRRDEDTRYELIADANRQSNAAQSRSSAPGAPTRHMAPLTVHEDPMRRMRHWHRRADIMIDVV